MRQRFGESCVRCYHRLHGWEQGKKEPARTFLVRVNCFLRGGEASVVQRAGQWRIRNVVDKDAETVKRFAAELGYRGPAFRAHEEYLPANVCRATVVAAPAELHRTLAMALARAGHRVLLERPITGTLKGNLALLRGTGSRRLDASLQYGRTLVQQGSIGRMFKAYSTL